MNVTAMDITPVTAENTLLISLKTSQTMNLSTLITRPTYLTRINSSHVSLHDQTATLCPVPESGILPTIAQTDRAPSYLQKTDRDL